MAGNDTIMRKTLLLFTLFALYSVQAQILQINLC